MGNSGGTRRNPDQANRYAKNIKILSFGRACDIERSGFGY